MVKGSYYDIVKIVDVSLFHAHTTYAPIKHFISHTMPQPHIINDPIQNPIIHIIICIIPKFLVHIIYIHFSILVHHLGITIYWHNHILA